MLWRREPEAQLHQGIPHLSSSGSFQIPANTLLNWADYLVSEHPEATALSSCLSALLRSQSLLSNLWICTFSYCSAPSTGKGFHKAVGVSLWGPAVSRSGCCHESEPRAAVRSTTQCQVSISGAFSQHQHLRHRTWTHPLKFDFAKGSWGAVTETQDLLSTQKSYPEKSIYSFKK